MKIGIIDAELISRKKHRFPNLASMKISAYHKSIGDNVTLLSKYINIGEYDKVYISKVFTDTKVPDDILKASNVEYGGTGFYYDKAPHLPEYIEHIMPDYNLYNTWIYNLLNNGEKRKNLEYYLDYSIGFTSRGCIRQCSFCVNKNYKSCKIHSPLSEFVDNNRKYICLLDDNILSCKHWKDIFKNLNDLGKPFQYKQGMDERLLNKEKCNIIFSSKWIGDYIFAFDNIEDSEIIEKKLKLIRTITDKKIKFYVFCAFNHDNINTYNEDFWINDIVDLFERIKILIKYKCYPYIMRYEDYNKSPYKGMYINIAGWCNQPHIFSKKSFREFCVASQDRSHSLNMCSTLRYMKDFEKQHPQISKKYFDMKLGNAKT